MASMTATMAADVQKAQINDELEHAISKLYKEAVYCFANTDDKRYGWLHQCYHNGINDQSCDWKVVIINVFRLIMAEGAFDEHTAAVVAICHDIINKAHALGWSSIDWSSEEAYKRFGAIRSVYNTKIEELLKENAPEKFSEKSLYEELLRLFIRLEWQISEGYLHLNLAPGYWGGWPYREGDDKSKEAIAARRREKLLTFAAELMRGNPCVVDAAASENLLFFFGLTHKGEIRSHVSLVKQVNTLAYERYLQGTSPEQRRQIEEARNLIDKSAEWYYKAGKERTSMAIAHVMHYVKDVVMWDGGGFRVETPKEVPSHCTPRQKKQIEEAINFLNTAIVYHEEEWNSATPVAYGIILDDIVEIIMSSS